jgi:hypothetical protein
MALGTCHELIPHHTCPSDIQNNLLSSNISMYQMFQHRLKVFTTKSINHLNKNSITRLQQEQRRQIIAVTLDCVKVDNTVGSLAKLAEKIWIVEAIHDHQVEGQCAQRFKTYVIGKQIMDQDRTVFLKFESFRRSQHMACCLDRLWCTITRHPVWRYHEQGIQCGGQQAWTWSKQALLLLSIFVLFADFCPM